MNREILFKAISLDGESVEGGSIIRDGDDNFCAIVPSGSDLQVSSIIRYIKVTPVRVDPSTVCQFTGLLDSKGVRIFEGDKIHYYSAKYWEQRSFPEYIDCSGYDVKKEEDVVIWAEGGWWGITSKTIDGEDYNWLSSCFYKCEQDTDEVDGDTELIGTVTVTGNIHDKELS